MVLDSGPGALDALLLRRSLGGTVGGGDPGPVEIIAYLDAIRPIPSNKQYLELPSLEFDVLSILQSLAGSSDDGLRGNVGDIVSVPCSRKNDEIEEQALGRLEERIAGYCGFSGKLK